MPKREVFFPPGTTREEIEREAQKNTRLLGWLLAGSVLASGLGWWLEHTAMWLILPVLAVALWILSQYENHRRRLRFIEWQMLVEREEKQEAEARAERLRKFRRGEWPST